MLAFFRRFERDEAIVGGGLWVVQDAPQLGEVAGPEEVGDFDHRLARQQCERFGFDLQEGLP